MAIPCLTDTDSIALSQDAGTGELNADLIVDPDANNSLTVSSSGVLVRGASPLLTELPSTPYDGQVVFYFSPDLGSPIMLRYNAAAAGPYPWDYLGGAPSWYASNNPADTYSSNTYGALTTHVALQIPSNLQGDFLVHHGCRINGPGGSERAYQSFKIGAGSAVDANAVAVSTTEIVVCSSQPVMAIGVAAGTILGLQHRTESGGTATYSFRWISVTPVSVAAA